MSDLSGLVPLNDKKGHRQPTGYPSAYGRVVNGRFVPIDSDGEPITRYTPEFPYGRVHLPGGSRAISEYGRSYPLPQALTELRVPKGVRLSIPRNPRLRANPNNNLEGWFQRNWKGVAAGIGGLVLLIIATR